MLPMREMTVARLLAVPSGLLGGGWSVGVLAGLQYILPNSHRATGTALVLLISSMFANVLGPVLAGQLSDWIAGAGPHGLRIGLGTLHLGLGGAEFGLKGPLVDGKQHVALFHEGTSLKMHLRDVTGHPRTQLDGLHRLDAPRELLPLDEFFLLNRCEGHRSRRHLHSAVGTTRRRFATGGEEQHEREEVLRFHGARWFWGGKLTSWLN